MVADDVRLMVVASFPVVTAGLRYLLDEVEGVQIVGEAASASEAIATLVRQPADVVIIDPDPLAMTMAAVEKIANVCDSRILVFTGCSDPTLCVRAMEMGASGVVSKEQPGELIVRAIRKVHAGELWLDRAQTATVLTHAMRRGRDPEVAKIETLTKREREIVAKVGEGLKNSAIAEQLFISEATVRNHLTSILSKLALSDRFELAVYAFRHHLVENGSSLLESRFHNVSAVLAEVADRPRATPKREVETSRAADPLSRDLWDNAPNRTPR